MSKELNIVEAYNMKKGTTFNVVFKDGSCSQNRVFSFGEYGTFFEDGVSTNLSVYFINAKFIPVQKPVSFMEAVEADRNHKRIKVDIRHLNNYPASAYKQLDKYSNLKEILVALILNVDYAWVHEVFEKGKWYIEEE